MTNSNFTIAPSIWAIYTWWWYTFTVLSIQENNSYSNKRIIYCSYTWNGNKDLELDLTKSSWDWDTTFYVRKIKWDWELLGNTTNINNTRFSKIINWNFNETKLAISSCLFDVDWKDIEIYDVNLYYDETTND